MSRQKTKPSPAGVPAVVSGRVRTRPQLDRREVPKPIDSPVRQAHSDRLDPKGSMLLASMVIAMRAVR